MTLAPKPQRLALVVTLCACCAAPFAAGVELPKRKPGQWQITRTSDNPKIPARIEDVCLDDATDAKLSAFALGTSQELCGRSDWRSAGSGKYSVDLVCKMGTTQMTIHGDTVYTGNTAYREDIKTHFEPPLFGRSDSVSVNEAKWTGACAPDMRPGDLVVRPTPSNPHGMRMNLTDTYKVPGH
jgi:hypothetical protein